MTRHAKSNGLPRWLKLAGLGVIAVGLIGALGACSGGTSAPTPTPSPTPIATSQPVTAEAGQELARQLGCSACHSSDGNLSVGPTWKGLFGAQQPLADGTTVTADEAFLRESIVDPNAKIAESFQPSIMPQDFGERLSDQQVAALIEYIKSLQ